MVETLCIMLAGDTFLPGLDLENAAIPAKQKKAGFILFDYPNAIAQGPFCWVRPGLKTAYWHERTSKAYAHHKKLGYKPLNSLFPGSQAHHLYLEGSLNFCIHIPHWLHKYYLHSSLDPDTLLSMNAISLDFWINEEMYFDLFELKKY